MFPISSFAVKRNCGGLTLVEVVISAALFSVMIAGLGLVDSSCRKLVRAQRETALASQTLGELVERLRASSWSNLTRASTSADLLAQFESTSLSSLSQPTLRITISPYPPVAPSPTPLVVERASNGSVTIISHPASGFSLRAFLAVRVDARIVWQAVDTSQQRTREIASVVSLAGLLR
jgi:hypothetical protein